MYWVGYSTDIVVALQCHPSSRIVPLNRKAHNPFQHDWWGWFQLCPCCGYEVGEWNRYSQRGCPSKKWECIHQENSIPRNRSNNQFVWVNLRASSDWVSRWRPSVWWFHEGRCSWCSSESRSIANSWSSTCKDWVKILDIRISNDSHTWRIIDCIGLICNRNREDTQGRRREWRDCQRSRGFLIRNGGGFCCRGSWWFWVCGW